MATYGKGYSVSAKLSFSGNGTVSVYTVPASSFAIFQCTPGTSGQLQIDSIPTLDGNGSASPYTGIYAGPGAVISISSGGGVWKINGVVFTNS